jgi:hypothetical protein
MTIGVMSAEELWANKKSNDQLAMILVAMTRANRGYTTGEKNAALGEAVRRLRSEEIYDHHAGVAG